MAGRRRWRSGDSIPNQAWYPEGYLDFEGRGRQLETFPRPAGAGVRGLGGPADPGPRRGRLRPASPTFPATSTSETARAHALAVEVAECGANCDHRLPGQVYDQPLLDYERWVLTARVPPWGERYAALAARYPDGLPEDFYEQERSDAEIAEMESLSYGMLGALRGE